MKTKKICALCLCAVMIFALAACGSPADKSDKPAETDVQNAQAVNPFVPCDTIAEAEKIAGFSITAPDNPTGIEAWEKNTIQLFYGEDGDEMLIRKGVGTEDISGDYNDYAQKIEVDGVTLKGENDKFSLAVWTKDGYTYSASVTKAMSQADILSLVAGIA